MTDPNDFARLLPGFDFMQSLVKNAGAALPNLGQWIAPTLDPEEIGKRIEQMRAVQFWLEQNARILAATVQALEVQRMTLATLKTMNLPLGELRGAYEMRPGAKAAGAPAPPPEAAATPVAAAAGAAVDAMQWWGALTQQFTELASQALKDSTADAAKSFAENVVKPTLAAADNMRQAASAAPAKAPPRAPAAQPPSTTPAPAPETTAGAPVPMSTAAVPDAGAGRPARKTAPRKRRQAAGGGTAR